MKTIKKKQWEKCLPCYKTIKKDGTRYMLYNEKGWAIWGIVKIKKD